MLWARQCGKTETLVLTTITLNCYIPHWLMENLPVTFIAPARTEQTIAVTRERLQTYTTKLRPWLSAVLGTEIILGDGRRTADYIFHDSSGYEGRIRCVSANPQAHVKGHTSRLQLFEQVEEMDEWKMMNDLFPFGAGSEAGCVRVLAGTPSLEIFNDYYYKKLDAISQKVPPYFVDWETAAKYRPSYAQFVQAEKANLGEDSDAFRTQYGLEWIIARNKLIDRATLLTLQWTPDKFTPDSKNLRAFGWDVAKRVDSTVITIGERQGPRILILAWLEMEGTDYEKQADEGVKFIEAWQASTGEIDITGPGDPVFDMVKKRLRTASIREQRFSLQENDRLYKQYERELIHQRLLYPTQDSREQRRFIEQHVDAEKIYSRNMLQVKAPDRPNVHDDYVASGALLVDALLSQRGTGLPVTVTSASDELFAN